MKQITQEKLKNILDYDPRSGEFRWLVTKGSQAISGSIAGSTLNTGYRAIVIDGRRYVSHRLAFLFMTGDHPTGMLDHINGDKSDNRWENIRECNNSQNLSNRPANKNNKSGYKGVCWVKRSNKWSARIMVNYTPLFLGLFDEKIEAAKAYNKAAREHFGEFAYLNDV